MATYMLPHILSNRRSIAWKSEGVISSAAGAGPLYPWARLSESQLVQDLISAAANALRTESCERFGRVLSAMETSSRGMGQ
jgi:hypothetical protein